MTVDPVKLYTGSITVRLSSKTACWLVVVEYEVFGATIKCSSKYLTTNHTNKPSACVYNNYFLL